MFFAVNLNASSNFEEEMAIGVECAREEGAKCIIGSMAFDLLRKGDGVKTMMGIDPDYGARMMVDAGVDVLGANCGAGIGLEWVARIAERYRAFQLSITERNACTCAGVVPQHPPKMLTPASSA